MKQLESFKRLIQILLSGVGLFLQILIFKKYYESYYTYWLRLDIWERGHWVVTLIFALLLISFSAMYGGTRIGYLRNAEIIFSQAMGTFVSGAIMYLVVSLICLRFINFSVYGTMLLTQLIVSIIWIIISNFLYQRVFPPRDLLLIHGDRPIDDIVRKIETRKDKFKICKTMNISEGTEKICAEAKVRYDAVVIWDIPVTERNVILKFCYGESIRVYIMPHISDVILAGAEQLHLFDSPLLLTREYTLKFEERVIKRLIDIIFSLILIVLTSPFMLITAILVKLYDRGPVLYKQVRCTRDGREFKILKFRSMRVDAEKDGVARLAKENDSRITPIGKFIRKVRLDELPQLFNIFIGDMSFIGPRPERPEIIAQYLEYMPEFAYRMKVKAGLAGYAQVYGKYNTTPYDKLKLDLCYIENYSVWLDIKLMLLTIKVLFWPDATEGVGEEQITAMKQMESDGEK
jgi:exopolysaccharide biosynthesis polyprenyl glycosylphosphotransferase